MYISIDFICSVFSKFVNYESRFRRKHNFLKTQDIEPMFGWCWTDVFAGLQYNIRITMFETNLNIVFVLLHYYRSIDTILNQNIKREINNG